MAKKSSGKKSALAKTTSSRMGAPAVPGGTKLDRLLQAKTIDPFYARALQSDTLRHIEELTDEEVEALISAHKKLSPGKRFQPDPDGSIF